MSSDGQPAPPFDTPSADDGCVVLSEASLGAAINKFVLPAMERMLASVVEEAVDTTIDRHMQELLFIVEGPHMNVRRRSNCAGQDLQGGNSSAHVIQTRNDLNSTLRRCHTLQCGENTDNLSWFTSSGPAARSQTTGCIDKYMEDAICNNGLYDRVSMASVLQSARSEASSGRQATNACSGSQPVKASQVSPAPDTDLDAVVPTNPARQATDRPNMRRQSSLGSQGAEHPGAAKPHLQMTSVPSNENERSSDEVSSKSIGSNLEDLASFDNEIHTEPANIQCLCFLYAAFGIILWTKKGRARVYKVAVQFASACAAAFCMMDLIKHPDRLYDLVPQVVFSISSLVSLTAGGNLNSILGGSKCVFGQHAQEHKFLTRWNNKGINQLLLLALIWVCNAGTSILQLCMFEGVMSVFAICRCVVAMLVAGLHLVTVHSVSHVLTFYELMLHSYCAEFHERHNWAHAVSAWNVVQATLHASSARIDSCFLAAQTSAFITLLSYAARILDLIISSSDDFTLMQGALLLGELPRLILALFPFVIFFKAAGVTEACSGIPPIVNAVDVEKGDVMDYERQYLVNFIIHSQTGFFVKGNRITATMLMNYCYLCGAIVCGLLTTGLSMASSP